MRTILLWLFLIRTASAATGALNVKDFGAVCDGSHAQADTAAFLAVLQAHNNGQSVVLPNGKCQLENSSGVFTVDGFSGTFRGEGRTSIISCTSLEHPCIRFVDANGLTISDLTITFDKPPDSRNGAQALVVDKSSNLELERLYIHDGPSSALNLNSDTHVSISDVEMENMKANGAFIVSSSDVNASRISSSNNQDAGFEVSQYDGQSGTSGNITLIGYTSFHDFSGILVNGSRNVRISDFTITDTYVNGIDIWQDRRTTKKAWPDQVVISEGLITGAGSMNPPNRAATAIRLRTPDNAPSEKMRISLSDIEISDGNIGATSLQIDPSEWYVVQLAGISVHNAGGEAFDLGGGEVIATNLQSDKSQSYAMVIRTVQNFTGAHLQLHDAQLSHADSRTLLNASKGKVSLSDVTVDQ